MPAAIVEAAPHVFGIPGLTTGAVGIMAVGLFGIIMWWIRGAPDRQRASNELLTAGEAVTKAQFDRLQTEITGLRERVVSLENKVLEKDELIVLRTRELADRDAEIIKLRAIIDSEGRVKELAQLAVSAERTLNARNQRDEK